MTARFDLDALRLQFPALGRTVHSHPAVFLDGAAGSQVPERVAVAVADYLRHTNANHGGPFATSVESDAVLDQAHHAAADFLGTSDPDTVAFGANMTTLTYAISRSLGKHFGKGGALLLTRMEHDAISLHGSNCQKTLDWKCGGWNSTRRRMNTGWKCLMNFLILEMCFLQP